MTTQRTLPLTLISDEAPNWELDERTVDLGRRRLAEARALLHSIRSPFEVEADQPISPPQTPARHAA